MNNFRRSMRVVPISLVRITLIRLSLYVCVFYMRRLCRTNSFLSSLFLFIVVSMVSAASFAQSTAAVISTMEEAEAMPLVDISAFKYSGGFRLPHDQFGDDELSTHSHSTGPIVYNPSNNSLFTVSHSRHQAIGEFAIPSIRLSDDPNQFATASLLQNFREFHEDGSALTGIDMFFRVTGMALVNSKLVVNYFSWYDAPAQETDTSVVFQNPKDLANTNIVGPFQIDGAAHASGWLTPVPNEWQQALGGDSIAGHSHGSIVSRLSVGPSAHVLNIADLTGVNEGSAVQSEALLDFSLAEPLYDTEVYDLDTVSVNDILYNENKQNDLWTIISGASYGFIIPNTGTYMTLGFAGGFESGLGYKIVQTDGNLCPGPCSFEPDDNYNYYWLWKISDLLKVKNGELRASDLRPYDRGEFDTRGNAAQIKGASFDYARNRLFVSLERGDEIEQYARPPLILVYQYGESASSPFYMNPVMDLLLDDK